MNNKQIINSLPQGTVLHGRAYSYVIEKALGQGSFGITYLAKAQMQGALGSLDTEVKVAIKEFFMKEVNGREGCTVTASANNGTFVDYKKKFKAEAEHLAKLEHQNIIHVVESFEENNTIYYVMEYIEGGTLDDYILHCGRLPEDIVRNYVSQIGSALHFMHQRKMLHLDLKPANIMRRKDGTLVLIDFGLSKQFDENGEPESTTSIGGGTPGYAPIEQMNYQRGDGFPTTMDVYALGATAFKMLVGKRVPEAAMILNDGFPVKMFTGLNVSQSLINVIAKAMASKRKDRFQTVDEMLKAITSTSCLNNQETEKTIKNDKNDTEENKVDYTEENDTKLKTHKRTSPVTPKTNRSEVWYYFKKTTNLVLYCTFLICCALVIEWAIPSFPALSFVTYNTSTDWSHVCHWTHLLSLSCFYIFIIHLIISISERKWIAITILCILFVMLGYNRYNLSNTKRLDRAIEAQDDIELSYFVRNDSTRAFVPTAYLLYTRCCDDTEELKKNFATIYNLFKESDNRTGKKDLDEFINGAKPRLENCGIILGETVEGDVILDVEQND